MRNIYTCLYIEIGMLAAINPVPRAASSTWTFESGALNPSDLTILRADSDGRSRSTARLTSSTSEILPHRVVICRGL